MRLLELWVKLLSKNGSAKAMCLHLDKFCQQHLGVLLERPLEQSGGLRHQVFELLTTRGHYALKVLDNFVMTKPGAVEQVIQSEILARQFAAKGFPAVCALELDGQYLHQLDKQQWVLVYPWAFGQQKYYPEFGVAEVEVIAKTLAKMHQAFALQPNVVIGHRDFDPKNVLWQGLDFQIIDWEYAGEIDPMEELFALAFEWSGFERGEFERGEIDETLFQGFFKAYADAGGTVISERLHSGLQGFIRNYEDWQQLNQERLQFEPDEIIKSKIRNQLQCIKVKLQFLYQTRDDFAGGLIMDLQRFH